MYNKGEGWGKTFNETLPHGLNSMFSPSESIWPITILYKNLAFTSSNSTAKASLVEKLNVLLQRKVV